MEGEGDEEEGKTEVEDRGDETEVVEEGDEERDEE